MPEIAEQYQTPIVVTGFEPLDILQGILQTVQQLEAGQAEVENDLGRQVRVKQPYIVDDLCIGCGICETKCPLPGQSAVFITSAGEDRDPENRLPTSAETGGLYGSGGG